jgi:hypothetical protein
MAARTARRNALAAAVIVVLAGRVSAAAASSPHAGIVDYFKLYSATGPSAPQFLRDAAANHESAEQVLRPGGSRMVTVDRRNGYLRIADSSNTDQVLTMALYTGADGTALIVVGGSDCADACDFTAQFLISGDGFLKAISDASVIPPLGPAQFIKRGHPMPKALAGIEPKVNYVPARVGTSLTLKPWYGYETEEQMDPASAAQSATWCCIGIACKGSLSGIRLFQ